MRRLFSSVATAFMSGVRSIEPSVDLFSIFLNGLVGPDWEKAKTQAEVRNSRFSAMLRNILISFLAVFGLSI